MTTDLKEIAEYTFEAAKQVGAELRPKDDWPPTLILYKDNATLIIPFGGELLVDAESKDFMASLCRLAVIRNRPDVAVYTSTAWMVFAKPDSKDAAELLKGTSIKNHPQRKEVFQMVTVNPTGGTLWFAPVLRSGGHPRLGELQRLPVPLSYDRFGQACLEGFATPDE